ncbi:MAG: hypothetical protein INH41_11505 [Myxococcaceae bacterium]|jgi:hypothetical protein|nr:hypothetical protein [Myxococcaceae bacterium]MCA3013008.1 hypothetical protein [Myxococcaceae bacterium]
MTRPDPALAYRDASAPVGLFESLHFKRPLTGEDVQVMPSGVGVSGNEMVAQHVEHVFKRALAECRRGLR